MYLLANDIDCLVSNYTRPKYVSTHDSTRSIATHHYLIEFGMLECQPPLQYIRYMFWFIIRLDFVVVWALR